MKLVDKYISTVSLEDSPSISIKINKSVYLWTQESLQVEACVQENESTRFFAASL